MFILELLNNLQQLLENNLWLTHPMNQNFKNNFTDSVTTYLDSRWKRK